MHCESISTNILAEKGRRVSHCPGKWECLSHGRAGYNHVGTPNGRACAIMDNAQMMAPWSGDEGHLPWYMQVPPSSGHPGGVNVLAGDGSVRFVKDTVSIPAWRALGSRAGGEALSADAY